MPDPIKPKAVTPANKIQRGGKNFDRTYLPTTTSFQDAPCVGDGCGKQVTKDSSKLLGYFDDSSSFDSKIFGTNNHSAYGQWNVPTTYAKKLGADGTPRTRRIDLTEKQLMNTQFQKDSISQGDKVYFRNPDMWNSHVGASNKLYGKGKTDQEVRHVAVAMGKNEKGEPLYQHSMGKNDLNRETMADIQKRGYLPKMAYRTKTTHAKLQGHPELGYDKKTLLKTNSDSEYVTKTTKYVNENKQEIGSRNGLTRSLMDKLGSNVAAIGVQESGAGFKKSADSKAVTKASWMGEAIDNVYDSPLANGAVKPLIKTAKNIATNVGAFGRMIAGGEFSKAFSQSGAKKSPWQLELEANKMSKNNPEAYKENYAKLKAQNNNSYVDVLPDASSRGYGKVKQIPAVAKELGVTKESLQGNYLNTDVESKIKNNAIASSAVLAENAKRIKQKFPKLNDDQVAEMAVTGYNSGLNSIMKSEYVANYVVNKKRGTDGKVLNSNYLEKIKKLKQPISNFKG